MACPYTRDNMKKVDAKIKELLSEPMKLDFIPQLKSHLKYMHQWTLGELRNPSKVGGGYIIKRKCYVRCVIIKSMRELAIILMLALVIKVTGGSNFEAIVLATIISVLIGIRVEVSKLQDKLK